MELHRLKKLAGILNESEADVIEMLKSLDYKPTRKKKIELSSRRGCHYK